MAVQGHADNESVIEHAMNEARLRNAPVLAVGVWEEDFGETPFVVTGNRGDLQQALLNMIINAERALAGRTGHIVVQLAREEDSVVVRVMDEGSGVTVLPPERAFEPFVTTCEPFEFAGLGLWAARRIAEQHGGTLTLEASSNGAVFAMRLPAMTLATKA